MNGFTGRVFCMSYFKLLMILSIIAATSAAEYGYGPDPNAEAPKPVNRAFLPEVFTIQGMVYCKSGPKLSPLKGSVVRIACLGVDNYGYETAPFSILTRPTDGNGYFLAKLSSKLLESEGVKISQCKAFLHSSPQKTCELPTDVNKGLSGATLSHFRPIGSNNIRLYSIGPFVYDTVPEQSPTSPYYGY